MKAPTALTTWLAIRLTVLMTSGQNSEAPPAPRASPSAATPETGESDSSRMPAPATQPPVMRARRVESRPSRRPAGAPGGGGHQLADDVGPGPEQDAGGQVVAQVEHAPGVHAALGDLGQGEDDQEDEQAVPAQAPHRVGRRLGRRPSGGGGRLRAVPGSVTRAHTPTARATTAMPGQTQRQDTPAWMTSAATAAPVERARVEERVEAHQRRRVARRGGATPRRSWRCRWSRPATSTRTSTTAKDHVSRVSASTHSRTDQANSAIHRSRRAPTRSARCAMTALDAPATAMATASSTPSWASLSEKACWMSNSITAQLPQKRPKVANDATTGPGPARSRSPIDGGRGRAQDVPAAPALARNAARGRRTTRVTRPAPDESAAVALEPGGGHGEDQPAALDLDQGGLGQHDRPHGDGCQVVELHPGGHARLRLGRGARRWRGRWPPRTAR